MAEIDADRARYLDKRPQHIGVAVGMGLDYKISNVSEDAAGRLKEGAGKATDDEKLGAEGKGDQAGANLKQASEKVKDAFKG